MKCADARTALLTAEPAELEGIGDSVLAEHIRACERCRAAARVLLDEQAVLAAALAETARPARTAEQAADAVLVTVAHDAAAAPAGTARASGIVPLKAARAALRRVIHPAAPWRVWAPVALAAALAAVMLVTRPRHDWQVPTAGEAAPAQVAVSAPPGKNVVVFGTRNPDIKVIWFYGSTD